MFLSVLKTVDDESRKRQILIRELCFACAIDIFVCRSISFTMVESEAGIREHSRWNSALFDFSANDIPHRKGYNG